MIANRRFVALLFAIVLCVGFTCPLTAYAQKVGSPAWKRQHAAKMKAGKARAEAMRKKHKANFGTSGSKISSSRRRSIRNSSTRKRSTNKQLASKKPIPFDAKSAPSPKASFIAILIGVKKSASYPAFLSYCCQERKDLYESTKSWSKSDHLKDHRRILTSITSVERVHVKGNEAKLYVRRTVDNGAVNEGVLTLRGEGKTWKYATYKDTSSIRWISIGQ